VQLTSRQIKACDVCQVTKKSCAGHPLSPTEYLQHQTKASGKKKSCPEGTPSPKGKGKRHQQSPDPDSDEEVTVISNLATIIGVDPADIEYDDQAWVAAANSIVAELAQTNGLLERSIQATEESSAAADQMSINMLRFLDQQRELHNSLLEAIRGRPSGSESGLSGQESPVDGLGEVEKEGEDEAGGNEAGGSSRSGGDMETGS
jgi:hypothetical protein